MNYDDLLKKFNDGEKIYYRKNENDKWSIVTKKDQLFPIHGYFYEIQTKDTNYQKIDSLIQFIKTKKNNNSIDCDDDFELGKQEGKNEAFEEILEYIKNNFHK